MGIIFDIKRCTIKDGPGIRTSVFLKGCPLRCQWCHNPESWHKHIEYLDNEQIGRDMSVSEIMQQVDTDQIFYQKSGGGLTITGGEPLFQADFTLQLLTAAKQARISTALDTSGYALWDVLCPILTVTDIVLFDYKTTDSKRHLELTGVDNKLIIDNLHKINQTDKQIYLRCPLIPGLNDDLPHLEAIAALAESLVNLVEITLLPYHPLGREKAERWGVATIPNLSGFTPVATSEGWRQIIAAKTTKKITIA